MAKAPSVRNVYVSTLRPVVICPYLCTCDFVCCEFVVLFAHQFFIRSPSRLPLAPGRRGLAGAQRAERGLLL